MGDVVVLVEGMCTPSRTHEPVPNSMTNVRKKRVEWSRQEIELLKRGAEEYKAWRNRWVLVKETFFKGSDRSAAHLRDKARLLKLV